MQTFDTLLDDLSKNGDEVLVERNGHIVARLVPNTSKTASLDSMRGRLQVLGDIVQPLDEPWNTTD